MSDIADIAPRSLVIPAGQSAADVRVRLVGDRLNELWEHLVMHLTRVEGAASDAAEAVLTVIDDDAPSPPPSTTYAVSAGAATVTEGDTGETVIVFTVRREGDTTGPGSVRYAFAHDLEAWDVVPGDLDGGAIEFAAGETEREVAVRLLGDIVRELDETLTLRLLDSFGESIDPAAAQATTSIKDNDPRDQGYRVNVQPVDAGGQLFPGILVEGDGGGATPARFGVFLPVGAGDPANAPVEVTVSLAPVVGNPSLDSLEPEDFVAGVFPSQTLLFTSNTVSGSSVGSGPASAPVIVFDVLADDLFEPETESAVVVATGPNVFQSFPGQTFLTVIDDDGPLYALFGPDGSSAAFEVAEGDAGATTIEITVTRSGFRNAETTLPLTIIASGGEGFEPAAEDFAPGFTLDIPVTFAVGEGLQTISIPIQGDTTPENDERFQVTALRPGGAGIFPGLLNEIGVTIIDDDSARFSVAALNTATDEGDPGQTTLIRFEVTRSGSISQTVEATFTVDARGGSEVGPADFSGGVAPAPRTVVFGPFVTRQFVDVAIRGDADFGPGTDDTARDETLRVRVGGSVATATVRDDDRPVFEIVARAASVEEGTGGTPTEVSFDVNRIGGSPAAGATVDVVLDQFNQSNFQIGNDDIVTQPGLDNASRRLDFAPGETTKTITWLIRQDTTPEFTEPLIPTLPSYPDSPRPSARTDILNDDFSDISIGDVTVDETAGELRFVVTQSNPSRNELGIDWWLRDDAGVVNFAGPTFGNVRFPFDGLVSGASVEIVIPVDEDDMVVEGDETFDISIDVGAGTRNRGSFRVVDGLAVGTIRDDDRMPPEVRIFDASIAEFGGVLTFQVTRTQTDGALEIPYSLEFGADPATSIDAFDLADGFDVGDGFPDGVVAFADGEATASVTVVVADDGLDEGTQELRVVLGPAPADVVLATATATGRILDDDGRPGGPTGGAWGDPHISTFDLFGYDFMGVGEFVLVRDAGAGPFEVQARMTSTGALASAVAAVATELGGRRVTVEFDKVLWAPERLLIDGVETVFASGDAPIDLGGERIRVIDGGLGLRLDYLGGETVLLQQGASVEVFLGESRGPQSVEGMLGDLDGDPFNDLRLADGSALPPFPSFSELYGAFAETWRVTEESSLFTYAEGESTADFTDASLPAAAISLADLPPALVEAARAFLIANGFPTSEAAPASVVRAASAALEVASDALLDAAILDLVLTGQLSFAQAALDRSIVDGPPVATGAPTDAPAAELAGVTATVFVLDEGDAGARQVDFLLWRNGGEEAARFAWRLAEGDGLADAADLAHGQATSGEVVLDPGETATLSVLVAGDRTPEPDEPLRLEIEALSGFGGLIAAPAAQTLVRNDDPVGPRASFGAFALDGPEGDVGSVTLASFEIVLDRPSETQVTVNWAVTVDGLGAASADADDFDGGLPSGSVVFEPGDTVLSTGLLWTGDAAFEPDEAFRVVLVGAVGAAVVGAAALAGAIRNDDADDANRPPAAADDTVTVEEDGAVEIDVLDNDEDAEDDPLTVTAVTQGANGMVTLADGVVAYTPAPDFNGQDSFAYTVSDGQGGTDTATVTVTVTPVNDAPVASDDDGEGYATDEDTAFVLPDLLANDSDPDGDALLILKIDASGAKGLVTLNPDGTVTYDPNGAFDDLAAGTQGADHFLYTVSDGKGGEATAEVTVQITGGDDPPGPNRILGTAANDRLVGTDGDDVIASGAGRSDIVAGGLGADRFVFGGEIQNGLRETDQIRDYDPGEGDVIDLGGATVVSFREAATSVRLVLDADGDVIVVSGVSRYDEIRFAEDLVV